MGFLPSIFISLDQSKDVCLYPLANNGRGFNSIYQPRMVFHPETERGITPRPHSSGSLRLVASRLGICMTTVASPNTLPLSRMPLAPIAKPLNFTSLGNACSGMRQTMYVSVRGTHCGSLRGNGSDQFRGGGHVDVGRRSCLASAPSCVDSVSVQLRCAMTS